jgi:hypothetical protein
MAISTVIEPSGAAVEETDETERAGSGTVGEGPGVAGSGVGVAGEPGVAVMTGLAVG